MLWLKFSLIFSLLLIESVYAQKYTSKQCLDAKFRTSVNNEGKFFGLIKNDLSISKNQCQIQINLKNILETKWVIDVCREPIHIKVTSKGSQSVYKRSRKCEKSDKSDFCAYYWELHDALQDNGLIFAKGERESLSTSHGQTYCSFLLIKRYLEDGHLFSKYDEPIDIFTPFDEKKQAAACDIPAKTELMPKPEAPPVPEAETTPATPELEVESKADELLDNPGEF